MKSQRRKQKKRLRSLKGKTEIQKYLKQTHKLRGLIQLIPRESLVLAFVKKKSHNPCIVLRKKTLFKLHLRFVSIAFSILVASLPETKMI